MINGDKLTAYTNAIQELVAYATKNFIFELMNKKDIMKDPDKFVYTLLFKLNNGLESANLLIMNILRKPQFLDSVQLILRTLLLDVITFDYILFKSNKDDDKFLSEVENLNYDHLKFTIKNIELFGCLYGDSKDTTDAIITDLKSKYPEYFDANGDPLSRFKGMKSGSGMIKEIKSGTSAEVPLDFLIMAFDNYSKFSKIEHLGGLTTFLVHRAYKLEHQNQVAIEILSSVHVILHYQHLLISMFFEEDLDIVRKYILLKEKIDKMNICD